MRDMNPNAIKKTFLAVVFVIIGASIALGGQIGVGAKLHIDTETDLTATFITLNGTFNAFALDGGVLWESLESIGDSSAAIWYYGQAKLRIPVADVFVPYAAAGMEAITISSLGSTQAFLLAVGGIELCLSERGIPFSVFAELNWTSPLETIQFGEAVLFFGIRVDLFSTGSAQEDASGEETIATQGEPEDLVESPEPAPCPTCDDDNVLRRWRQGG